LLAIPFFTLMGTILERCGLAEDMLDSMGQLFGPVKGGLGYSVIIVGFILGAITGTVAGQVIAMAMISLPVMVRYGYNIRYSTGVLAASGTITQLVPPSLVLVVMADQLGKSVGDMYKGAWGPSILQILLFLIYTFLITRLRPNDLPGIPKEARTLNGWMLWKKCLRGIIPSAVLIFAVLGSMGGIPGMCYWLAYSCGNPSATELSSAQPSPHQYHANHFDGRLHFDWLTIILTCVSRG
jgi:TRAP-type mannitol/chloroaromatic compound transport system permease large subunit